MASSTVSGVGSGIDTQSIVTALVNAEKAPKQKQIDTQTTTASTTLSAISVIKSALDTYRTAVANINTAASFNSLSGSSSDEKIAKATIDSAATSGTYALSVSQLATSSKVTTAVFAEGSTSSVNTSTEAKTLSITQGSSTYSIEIAAGATLDDTRKAINTQLSSKGISATILAGTDGARLVIGTSTTGAGNDITLDGLDSLSSGATESAGVNAKYTIDGNAIESKSNTVTSALTGVTLNLVAKGDTTVTVAKDTSTIKISAQAFVTAYNALMTAINAQTKVTATTTTDGASTSAGALTGDATMRSLVNSIRNELVSGNTSSTASSGLTSLSQLGITTDKSTGLLSLDDTKWTKAAATYGSGITSLFTGTTGLLTRMAKATDAFASTTGVLVSRQNSLTDTLSSLKTDQDSLDRRVASLQTSLTAKYTAMDGVVAQLNATKSSILTTLNALNNSSSDN